VRLQYWVAPRQARIEQCSELGQGMTSNETAGCAFTQVPARGFLTELKEPRELSRVKVYLFRYRCSND
jgi:hypothetical protein